MAYTYLIGWSKYQKYYYGVRFAKNSIPQDLWIKYKTSSKHVKFYASKYGDPDVIQIRRIFNNAEQARIWEAKVLRRLDVLNNPKMLNKTDNISICQTTTRAYNGLPNPMLGRKHNAESIEKMKKPKSDIAKINMKGKRPHVNQKGIKNNAFKGFIHTPYGIFESLKEAAKVENVNFSTIAWRIKNINYNEYNRVM